MKRLIICGLTLAALVLVSASCGGDPRPEAAGAPSVDTPAGLGKEMCARITAGDIEGVFNLMHPDVLDAIEADAEAAEPGRWQKEIDMQYDAYKRNPVEECVVINSTSADCIDEVVVAYKEKYGVELGGCGDIKLRISKRTDQDMDAGFADASQEGEFPVLQIDGKWWIGGM